MPFDKKSDLEKQAWAWIFKISPNQIERAHLETAYRISASVKKCKSCKKNCSSNPRCLTGLGEESYIKSQPVKVVTLESSLQELRNPSEYVGLMNLGATCYVNSLIQVWFHNEDMRRIIYKWNIEDDPDEREKMQQSKSENEPYCPGTAVGQLQYIFAMMQFGNHKHHDPISLAMALSLDLTTQQDAQEFSKLLLCHIEGKFQQNEELTQMLQKLTQGRYSYINCCKTCGTEHSTSTAFYELDLQLASTLAEAIEKYLVEEQLSGTNQYYCTTCDNKQDATRFIRLDSLPDTLNIQLLRFVFHRISGRKKKLSTSIQFPEELDMSEYLRCPPRTHIFSLVAALNHKGTSAHSGHFSANIRDALGEWYEFSDDKVEKMMNKRMEDDTIQENGKVSKRARIPKGYFSSNTAYMLVYKRIPPSSIDVKHKQLKKLTIGSNHLADKDITRNVMKGKRVMTESRVVDSHIVEKKTKLENANYMDENHHVNNADIDNYRHESNLNGEGDSNVKTLHLSEVKSSFQDNTDYMTMSCGEREAYEEVEFKKWGLSTVMQNLVRRENESHELSLLAQQEGKQKELYEQNEKRQLVIDFYEIISHMTSDEEYRWIPTEWLTNWLKGSRRVDRDNAKSIPAIDSTSLTCPHGNMDPLKTGKSKYVPAEAARLLFDKYSNRIVLTQDSLCNVCVKKQCEKLRFKENLEQDHKEVSEIMKTFKQLPNVEGYIVGTESLRCWKQLAMREFLYNVDQIEIDQQEDSEEDEEVNFNEDLLCVHNALRTPDSKRKIVPHVAWSILRKYFPQSAEYSSNAESCTICQDNLEVARKTKESDKVNAKQQKDLLSDLYYEKNRNKIMDAVECDKPCYIVEKGFLDTWRTFIRYAENFSRPPPPGIQNARVLCEPHKGFMHQTSPNCTKQYSIVSAEEWETLNRFYAVDYPIRISKTDTPGVYITDPDECTCCMLERVEQERLESLKYDKATIYIKRLDDNDGSNGIEMSDPSTAPSSSRPSRRGRKVKGSHELTVSSENTLKDLKVMTMQIYRAGPYDQHIILGEHELTDDMQTLSALGIYPGAFLKLKIDVPVETSDTEFDIVNQEYTSPERGFKGTELAG